MISTYAFLILWLLFFVLYVMLFSPQKPQCVGDLYNRIGDLYKAKTTESIVQPVQYNTINILICDWNI